MPQKFVKSQSITVNDVQTENHCTCLTNFMYISTCCVLMLIKYYKNESGIFFDM